MEAVIITTSTARTTETVTRPDKSNWLTNLVAKVRGLTSRVKSPKSPAKKEPQRPNLNEKGRLYDPFSWVRHVLLWTNFQIVFLGVACVAVTIMAAVVKNRGLMVIDLPDSLRDRAYRQFDIKGVDRDEFDRFTMGTLTMMHQFDFRNMPNVELLKGLVNPDVYMAVQSRYNKNAQSIRSKGIIHDLHITAIENVYPSVNQKSYSATVKGYLNVSSFAHDKKEVQFLPYRARVVVRVQPNTSINRSGYYLMQIHEFAGDEAARRFDSEISAELQKKGLK